MVKAFTLLQMELKEKFQNRNLLCKHRCYIADISFDCHSFIWKSRNIWHSKQNRIYPIHVIFINSLAICGKHVVSCI